MAHSHRAGLARGHFSPLSRAVGKSTGRPASSRAGAQNIGPSALDRCAAGARSCPRTRRRPPPRWQGSSRRWVTCETVLSQPNTGSRTSPGSDCCHAGAPRGGAARTGSRAQQRLIDRGRSDLCSERQHGRCGRFSCASRAQPSWGSPRAHAPSSTLCRCLALTSQHWEGNEWLSVNCGQSPEVLRFLSALISSCKCLRPYSV